MAAHTKALGIDVPATLLGRRADRVIKRMPALGPTLTCGDVRCRAAVGGIAEIKTEAICKVCCSTPVFVRGPQFLTGGCGPTEQTGEVRIAPFFCGERFPFRDLTPYVAGTDPERLPVCALGFKTRETVHGEREISDHAESSA